MDSELVTRIANNPNYQALKAKRTSFGWWLTLVMMIAYIQQGRSGTQYSFPISRAGSIAVGQGIRGMNEISEFHIVSREFPGHYLARRFIDTIGE